MSLGVGIAVAVLLLLSFLLGNISGLLFALRVRVKLLEEVNRHTNVTSGPGPSTPPIVPITTTAEVE